MDPYHAVRSASPPDALAQTIAVPAVHPPMRLPSFPNLERTAVLRTRVSAPFQVPGGTTRMGMLVKSPVHPLWFQHNQTLHAQSVFATTLPGTIFTPSSLNSTFDLTGVFAYLTDATATILDPVLTAENYPVGVLDNGDMFFYIPMGMMAKVELVLSAAVAYTGEVSVEWFDGSERLSTFESFTTPSPSSFVSITLTSQKGSWFRPTLLRMNVGGNYSLQSISAGVTTDGSLTAPAGTAVISAFTPFSPVPELSNSTLPYSSTRANAVGLLLSNVSSVLNKEGTVTCARLPRTLSCWADGVDLYSALDIASLSQFVSANPAERYYGPLEKGLYTFCLPDASSATFRDCITDLKFRRGNTVYRSVPGFPLEGFDYMNYFLLTDNDSSGSTSLTVNVDVHLEFRTSSALFNLDFSTTPLEVFHVAQMALARSGVFFENPVHLRVISEVMRRGVQALRPVVSKGVGMLAAKAAPHAAALSKKAVSAAAAKLADSVAGKKKPKPAPKAAPVQVVVNTGKASKGKKGKAGKAV